MLSGVVKTVFNFKELSTGNLCMPAQNIKTLLNGGYVLTSFLLGMTFIGFGNDEDGSRYFCSPSLSKSSCSHSVLCCGLGCAFLANQAVSLMGDPDHADSSFALFSRLLNCAVI